MTGIASPRKIQYLSYLVLIISVFSLSAFGAAGDVDSSFLATTGDLDPTFNASAFGNFNGNVNVIKVQPDGKILIGGFFTEVNGFAASGIGRFNADGTADTSFRSLDFYNNLGTGGAIFAIALQSDGKILVGGNFLGADSVAKSGVRRLNSDGSLDTSFTVVEITSSRTVYEIKVQSDGKILVGGDYQSNTSFNIVRLNTDGTVDATFAPFSNVSVVRDLEIQSDGKILVGGFFSLLRLTTTGAIDNTFPTVNATSIEVVKIRADGKILIGGNFTTVNGFTQGRISLINPDGSIDLTFNQNNQGANGAINDISLKPDGKILIGGSFSAYNTISRTRIAQLNADGSLDTSFQNNSTLNLSLVNDVELLPDGRVLVGINFQSGVSSLTRFNADGTFDAAFAPIISRSGTVYKILPLPDGKILVAGEFLFANSVRRNSLARLNADGSVDTSFVPYFINLAQIPMIFALAVQPDGKILVGFNTGSAVRRLNSDGTEDTSFTTTLSIVVNDLAVLPNGQILVGGSNGFIRRLNTNGTVDTSFGAVQPNSTVNKLSVQADGKIFISGNFTQIGTSLRGGIARLNADGTLDNTFNPPGGANSTVYTFDLQPDGKIVLGGAFTALNGSSNQVRIGRLNSDGSLDAGFVQNTNGAVLSIKVQPDGKILLGGTMSVVQGAAHNGIARLNSDGTVDSAFNTFANTTVRDISLQADGKIMISGLFTKINRLSAVRIARLINAIQPSRTQFDYDGDGKADISVYRPSEGVWYILRSSDFGVTQRQFAIPADIPAPADFDGDGKTDIAIFRQSNGDWWSLSSINGAQINARLGQVGDIPRPSDFDGDGRADYVVFRPSTNQWLRSSSANGATSNRTFGLAGDKPVTGDFDGDGKSDLAIYRPSDGNWWWQSGVDNVPRATRWGISTDVPSPADFDGDGKTDFAVFRPETGVWYVYNSSNGSATIVPFGTSEDKPVAADYDGDGKADLAVFRPSTGIWYLLRSTSGFTGFQFGISTDRPTPNAFIP